MSLLSRLRARWDTLVVLLIAAGCALPALLPLAEGQLPGRPDTPTDGASTIFIYEQVRRGLLDGSILGTIDAMWYPTGRPFLLAVQNVLDAILAAPLGTLFGPYRGYGFFLALVLATNAVAGAWFAGKLTGSPTARVAGALVLGACPYAWGELHWGRPTQAMLAFVPLAAGLAWDAPHSRGRAAAAGVAFALVGYGYWFYAIFLAPLLVVLTVGRAGLRRGLPALGIIGGVACALVAPFVVFVARSWGSVPASADVTSFGSAWSPAGGIGYRVGPETSAYLPQLLLVAALAALFTQHRRVALGSLAAAGLLVSLAFGEGFTRDGTHYTLPLAWLRELPGMTRFWWPQRVLGVATVALLVPIAFAVGSERRLLRGLSVAAVLLSAAQCMRSPGPMGRFPVARVAAWARTLPPGAVLRLPMLNPEFGRRFLLSQPQTGRPLVNGMATWDASMWPADYREFFVSQPLLIAIEHAESGMAPFPVVFDDIARLRRVGVAGIVAERETPAAVVALLDTWLGSPTVDDDLGQSWWRLDR